MHYLARSVGTYLGRARVLEITIQSRIWARGQKILREFVEILDIMLNRMSIRISQDMQLRTPVTGPLLYTESKHNFFLDITAK